MINIVGLRKIWFLFSGALLTLSIAALVIWGLKLGVDFKGGTLIEIAVSNTSAEEIRTALEPAALHSLVIQPTDRGTYILRMDMIDEAKHQDILSILAKVGSTEEQNFATVGPTIGDELKQRAIIAIILASLAIIFYLAATFRRVPKPVTSWRFGIIAVITLLHDITVVLGVFVLLGRAFGGFEADSLFVVAALTIMGFSVHDTIVVFDRVRENLRSRAGEALESIVNHSVVETIARSLNTTLTVILVLMALYLLGGASTKNFVLALIVGVTVGTYSSIFIAAPLLVAWEQIASRRK